MSSPCLRHSYGFDLDIVKSPSTSTRTSNTSSPSSTLSETSNSLSTRKPRTPRKRPNQTYNEAAALLSTAYPNIFSAKNCKFTKPHHLLDQSSSPELLWPFRVFDEDSGFPLHQVQPIESDKPNFLNEAKVSNLMNSCEKFACKSDSNSVGNSSEFGGYEEDFDAESILDEEIEEGIDSIMGNLSVSKENSDELTNKDGKFWYGNPMGFQFNGRFQGFGNGISMRKGVRAFRQGDEGNWWCFPIVDMLQISPRLSNNVPDKPKPKLKPPAKSNSGDKKKSKVEKPAAELKNLESAKENSDPESTAGGLMLKLNYDGVLNAWSDRGSPFSEEFSGSDSPTDVSARLAQIELLFTENGGIREASVLRYKEKRRTRLFSKKIRYQVRKVNADQRPRMKGRFVRRPHSSASSQRREE